MAKKFQIAVEAERFIHNDLSNCALHFSETIREKVISGETEGVYLDMMAALVFSAFSIEAKINFVGWRVLEDGWPERANLWEKIALLSKVLGFEVDRGSRPWQTLRNLKKFRDTLAHGKPEVVEEVKVVDVEPEVWDALKAQWEYSVTPEFVGQCREDENQIWELLLEAADIELFTTLTHGGHSLRSLTEGD